MTLEELLNKLIEKGWKPRGKNYGIVDFLGVLVFVDLNDGRLQRKNALDLRKLTSKESGLWHFVCENGYNQYKKEYRRGYTKHNTKAEYWDEGDYEYRLIESALKDESELESFILDNIKIDDK